MAKVGSKKLKPPNQPKKTLKPFEDALNLEVFLNYQEGNSSVGATLLKLPNQESYQIVFAFKCRGIAPILSQQEISNAVRGLQALNDLPLGETLTFHFGLFTSDGDRQEQLGQQMDHVSSSALRFLIGGQAKRTRELTESGIRKHNFLNLYVTYTVEEKKEGGSKKGGDFFDQMLHGAEKWWYQLTGAYEEVTQLALQEILYEAYRQGFNRYRRLLNYQLGLSCEGMTITEIKQCAWQLFNPTVDPLHPLPTLEIQVKTQEIKETATELSAKTYLLDRCVPQAKRRSIQLGEEEIGVLVFAQKPELPDDDPIGQLYYLWETFLSKPSVYDIEMISQIQHNSNRAFREKMQVLSKQAQADANAAVERGERDVGASLAAEEALEAQIALFQDNEPFKTGTVILVHRPDLNALDAACADISSYFRREGWVIREEEYAWKIWLESLKLVQWGKLLSKPFNRRRTYVSAEISRILPLISNYSLETEGFELIAEEGGTPIYVNVPNESFHIGLFAASGSGKSVFLSDLVAQLLPYNIPTTLLEFPKKDGTGSFDGLASYLPNYCSYVDIGQANCGLNLLEPPNLQGFSPEEKKERFKDFTEEVLGILEAMVLGFHQESSVGVNPDMIRSLLGLALDTFYSHEEIIERYGAAFQFGFKSPEWTNMPTLSDFLPFISVERLRLQAEGGEEILRNLQLIKLKLRDWLNSRIGQFLSRPTTFNSDNLIQILSLRGLSRESDAGIMGAIAYMGAFRRSLQYKDSVFVIDEAAIFLSFDSMAQRIGELSANGRKSGIRLILAAQGLGSILKCAAADKILDNLKIKLVGRIYPQSIEQYVEVLKYPYDLILENAGEQYGINRQDSYTRWLYDDGRLIPVRHYPSLELLALVANSTKEAQMRQEFWQKYQGDAILGLHELTQKFAQNGSK